MGIRTITERFFYDALLSIFGLFVICKSPSKFISERLFPKKPRITDCIWVHAVSMGEVRAAFALLRALRKHYPSEKIVLSVITKTGFAEATRFLEREKCIDDVFYMPFDIGAIIRPFVCALSPKLLIFIETDAWYQLLGAVSCPTLIVSAKISERSFHRLEMFLPFAKALYGRLCHIACQNAEYAKRFEVLGAKSVSVMGNIKLDSTPRQMSREERDRLFQELGGRPYICVGSTHPKEEELLLDALLPLGFLIILVPRHPERFDAVAALLTERKIAFSRYSWGKVIGNEAVIVMDQMGRLCDLYQGASLAVVGGSFVDGIGGHNILEPLYFHVPTFFGPYCWGQKDFVFLARFAAIQCHHYELQTQIQALLSSTERLETMKAAAEAVWCDGAGALKKAFTKIEEMLDSRALPRGRAGVSSLGS